MVDPLLSLPTIDDVSPVSDDPSTQFSHKESLSYDSSLFWVAIWSGSRTRYSNSGVVTNKTQPPIPLPTSLIETDPFSKLRELPFVTPGVTPNGGSSVPLTDGVRNPG